MALRSVILEALLCALEQRRNRMAAPWSRPKAPEECAEPQMNGGFQFGSVGIGHSPVIASAKWFEGSFHRENDMFGKIKTAALSAVVAFGALAAAPGTASADSLHIVYKNGELGFGINVNDGYGYKKGCTPGKALQKAKWMGVEEGAHRRDRQEEEDRHRPARSMATTHMSRSARRPAARSSGSCRLRGQFWPQRPSSSGLSRSLPARMKMTEITPKTGDTDKCSDQAEHDGKSRNCSPMKSASFGLQSTCGGRRTTRQALSPRRRSVYETPRRRAA